MRIGYTGKWPSLCVGTLSITLADGRSWAIESPLRTGGCEQPKEGED
jgi:hypothetical protein